ncbi:class I SAM-dependent methyltransferase [Streptomyces gamaensis]|uniref:Class I SAM-dependent methyltransferase n=1 Tax=Streptomyces gamaensis TaxID=1763542 RepID=A0ABW0YZZ4_9ACTN
MSGQHSAAGPDSYEPVAGLYDLFAAARGKEALPDAAGFAQAARPGDRVLDIGAGSGRVALAVAAAGASVWCVEPSPAMRSVLLGKLAASPGLWPRVTVLAGRAPRFDAGRPPGRPGSFDYATLAGVLQFLTPAERPVLFRTVARYLRPGGLLALDMVADTPLPDTRQRPGERTGETRAATATVGDTTYALYAAEETVSARHSRIHYRLTTHERPEGTAARSADHTFVRDHHTHLLQEVVHDLAECGFAQELVPPAAPGLAAVRTFRRNHGLYGRE